MNLAAGSFCGTCTRRTVRAFTSCFKYDLYHENGHVLAACHTIRSLTLLGDLKADATPFHKSAALMSLETVTLINVAPSFAIVEHLSRIKNLRQVEWRWYSFGGLDERRDSSNTDERWDSMGDPFPDMSRVWASICLIFGGHFGHITGTTAVQRLLGVPRSRPARVCLILCQEDAADTRKALANIRSTLSTSSRGSRICSATS